MLREGYPFTTLVKESKRQGIAKGIRKIQKEQDGSFIYMDPWSKAARQIISSLRKNEIVCLIADEKRKHTGIYVEFFGEPALTATGPAVLSLRTGAPILPISDLHSLSETMILGSKASTTFLALLLIGYPS